MSYRTVVEFTFILSGGLLEYLESQILYLIEEPPDDETGHVLSTAAREWRETEDLLMAVEQQLYKPRVEHLYAVERCAS